MGDGSRRAFDLRREPQGTAYAALLRLGATSCTQALLVVRDRSQLAPSGVAVLNRLAPFLRSQAEAGEWPGTQLLGHTATVLRYELSPAVIEVLSTATDHLYGWRAPELPEDLCLLRADGEPWLTTIAHERDAWITVTPSEFAEIAAHPQIGALFR